MILPSISDFNLVTEPNTIIADKTMYITKLDREEEYQYVSLRPRRWGKSAFLQTLGSYYDKGNKDSFDEIFGQLYIGKHPTPYRSSLLCLLFDFSSISVIELMRMMGDFDRVISASLRRFLVKNAKFLGDPDIERLMKR